MRDADPAPDRLDARVRARQVPCLCPRQHDALDAAGRPIPGTGQTARTLAYFLGRGTLREQVACNGCPRTWSRANA